ncbi:MAG: hypothetical protein Kow0077_30920 [Anaerolineae bacterium]
MGILPTFIDKRAATVDLAYPETAPAHLALNIPFGRLTLEPGAGNSLVSGKVTYNVAELKPAYSLKGRTVRIRQKARLLIPTGEIVNHWDFLLGDAAPFSLEAQCGAAEARLTLGGVPLTGLKLDSGAGEMRVTFDAPNPARLIEGKISAGAGRTTLRNLLNANAEYLHIRGGVGQIVAEFTGDGLQASGCARIAAGMGEVQIVLEEDAPLRVIASMGLGDIKADPDLIQRNGGYETPAYAGSEVRFDIEVSGGVGSVRLEVA